MKRFPVILFLFVVFTSLSFAQMQIGPKIGGNFANVNGDDAGNPDTKFGICVGGFFMYQISPLFALQPEAYYTMKGATDKASIGGTTFDLSMNYNYIEIPVLVKLIIPITSSSLHPAIFAGPFIGINTSATFEAESDNQSEETDIEDVNSTEFGLQFGGGLGFDIWDGEMGVDLRYILGLTSVDDSANEFDIKHGVINLNLYYGFILR